MARVVVTIRVMPVSPSIDLNKLEEKILNSIKKILGDTETKTEKEPIGFGLSSLKIIFVMDENKKLDPIEDSVSKIGGVSSVEITDVRRAIG